MPYLAAELQYEWGSEFEFDPDVLGEIETHVATLNVKGIFTSPNVGPIQPYLLAGAGVMHAEAEVLGIDVDDTGFAARFGGGFDLYFADNIAGIAEVTYVLPTGDVDGLDYLSLAWGLRYQF
jgi:opacity protein-like surface antigen